MNVENQNLIDVIKQYYPTPIAFNYQQMLREIVPERRISRMKDLAESIIYYLAIVAASDYIESPSYVRLIADPNTAKRNFVYQNLRGHIMLGKYVALLKGAVKQLTDNSMRPFTPELQSFLERNTSLIDDLHKFRNTEWGHVATRQSEFYKELYQSYREKFNTLLEEMSFLSNYLLVTPTITRTLPDGTGYSYTCLLCMGENLFFSHVTLESRKAVLENRLYVYDKNTRDFLSLSPLMVIEAFPPDMRQRLFFIQSIKQSTLEYLDLQEGNRLSSTVYVAEFQRKTGILSETVPEELSAEAPVEHHLLFPQVAVVPQPRRGLSANEGVVGDEIQVTIHMINSGQETAVDLSFEDVIPPGLKLVSGKAFVKGETLGQFERRTVSYVVEAEQIGEYLLPATLISYKDPSGRSYKTEIRPSSITVSLNFRSRFVGRTDSLSLLKKRLEAAAAGRGKVVLIAGEAGVGKTRLAEEICKMAKAQGATVSKGECRDKDTPIPYLPFLKALKSIGESLPTALAGDRLSREMLSGFAERGVAPSQHIETRIVQFQSITERLLRAAQKSEIIILLDDLQWSDRDSLALLLELADQIHSLPILIIATYRSDEVSEHLKDVITKLARYELCDELRLQRLDLSQTGELITSVLGGAVDGELSSRIHAESQGNPFFMSEILKMLLDGNYIRLLDGIWTPVTALSAIDIPSKVYEVILRRLENLTEQHRSLLQFAAVEGHVFTVDSALITGYEMLTNIQVKDWVLMKDLGFLERVFHIIRSRGKDFEFDHTKIREVLYNELPPRLRILCHRHIANYIEERYQQKPSDEDLFDLADHFYKSESWEKAADYLTKAGERAVQMSAYSSAEHYFELAQHSLEKAQLREETKQKIAVYIHRGLSDIAEVSFQWELCRHHLVRAREIAANLEDQQPHAQVLIALANLYEAKDELDQATALTVEAQEIAKRFSLDKQHADALIAFAWQHGKRGKHKEALDFFEDAIQLFKQVGDSSGEAEALRDMGDLYSRLGNHPMALGLHEKALALFEALKNRRGEGITLRYIGNCYREMGNWRLASEYYERSLIIRREIGDVRGLGFSLVDLADTFVRMHRLSAAHDLLNEALETARNIRDRQSECYVLSWTADLARKRGQMDQAIEIMQGALAVAKEIADVSRQCSALRTLGNLTRECGHDDKAVEYLEKALTTAREAENHAEEGSCLSALGSYYDIVGNLDKAIEYFNQSISLRQLLGDQKLAASDLWSLGEIHESRKDYDQAMECYETGLALKKEVHDRLGETRSMRMIAKLHRRRGSYEEAVGVFEQALVIDRDLGNKTGEINTLIGLAKVYEDTNNSDEALRVLRERLIIEIEVDDSDGQANAHRSIAEILEMRNDRVQTLEHYEQAAAIDRTIGNTRSLSIDLNCLGRTQYKLGNWSEALGHYQEALQLKRELSDLNGESISLTGLARTCEAKGEHRRSLEYYQEALSIDRSRGDQKSVSVDLQDLGTLHRNLENWTESLACLYEALDLHRELSSAVGESVVFTELARTYREMGEEARALEYFNRALELDRSLDNKAAVLVDLNELGATYRATRDWDEAIRFYTESLELSREMNNRRGESRALTGLAQTYAVKGDEDKAKEYEEQAIKIREEESDLLGQARTVHDIAFANYRRNEITKAKDYYQQALALYGKLEKPESEANVRYGLGRCLNKLGQTVLACEQFEGALQLFSQIADLDGQKSVQITLADVWIKKDSEKAFQYGEAAAQIDRARDNRQGELETRKLVARMFSQNGKMAESKRAFGVALELARELGDKNSETLCYSQLAHISLGLGELDAACQFYEQAIDLDRELDRRDWLAIDCKNLARALTKKGDVEQAIANFETSVTAGEDTTDVEALVDTYLLLGNLQRRVQRLSAASASFQKALGAAERSDNPQTIALVLLYLSRIAVESEEPAEAHSYAEKSLVVAKGTENWSIAVEALRQLAKVEVANGELENSEAHLVEALELNRKFEKDGQIETHIRTNLGDLYYRMGYLDQAQQHLNRAIELDRSFGKKDWEATDLMLLGKTFIKDDPIVAENHYIAALAIFEGLDDKDRSCDVLKALANLAQQLGDIDKAKTLIDKAADLYHRDGNLHGELFCKMQSGHLCMLKNALDEAREQYQQAAGICQQLGELRWEAVACLNLGAVYRSLTETGQALASVERAKAIYMRLSDFQGLAEVANIIYDLSERWRLVKQTPRIASGSNGQSKLPTPTNGMSSAMSRIKQLLQEAGRKFSELDEEYVLMLFQGKNVDTIAVYIHSSNSFVTFYTPLMIPPDTDLPTFYDNLLQLSLRIYFAKFSIDPEGTPLLQIQWPSTDINPDELSTALESLVTYADQYGVEHSRLSVANVRQSQEQTNT